MTAASSLPLPGGRVVPGWWRDLAPWHPRRLWFARPTVYRVEALVEVAHLRPLDPLHLGLLRALAVGSGPAKLHLDRALLGQALRDLAAHGLIGPAAGSANCAPEGNGNWELTDAGRQALDRGGVVERQRQRRVFPFADVGAAGLQYLPLSRPAGSPAAVPEDWRFDPVVLEDCVARPEGWKARQRFPAEVQAVARGRAEEDWRSVMVVGAEPSLLVLAQTSTAVSLVGFPVQPQGWAVQGPPVLALEEPWPDAVKALTAEPGPEAWREAWNAWCQARGLPAAEGSACRLRAEGHRLSVQAPGRVLERVRAARGEAWLLAGAGPSWAVAEWIEEKG
jgi:hypothetical protein